MNMQSNGLHRWSMYYLISMIDKERRLALCYQLSFLLMLGLNASVIRVKHLVETSSTSNFNLVTETFPFMRSCWKKNNLRVWQRGNTGIPVHLRIIWVGWQSHVEQWNKTGVVHWAEGITVVDSTDSAKVRVSSVLCSGKTKPSNEIRFGMQIGWVKSPKSIRADEIRTSHLWFTFHYVLLTYYASICFYTRRYLLCIRFNTVKSGRGNPAHAQ